MRACKNCGTKFDESVSFCPICGTNVKTNQPASAAKEPISIGGWIGRSLIPCIPLVGSIIYLVMLFIWSGDKTKEDTFRNWAKAQLIIMLIVVIVTIVVAVLFGATLIAMIDYL